MCAIFLRTVCVCERGEMLEECVCKIRMLCVYNTSFSWPVNCTVYGYPDISIRGNAPLWITASWNKHTCLLFQYAAHSNPIKHLFECELHNHKRTLVSAFDFFLLMFSCWWFKSKVGTNDWIMLLWKTACREKEIQR